MAIITKKLGNSRKLIKNRFRKHFSDGLGGMRFDAFCAGWLESWKENKANRNDLFDENVKLKKALSDLMWLEDEQPDWAGEGDSPFEIARKLLEK